MRGCCVKMDPFGFYDHLCRVGVFVRASGREIKRQSCQIAVDAAIIYIQFNIIFLKISGIRPELGHNMS